MSDDVEVIEIFPRFNRKLDLSLIVEVEGIERRYYLSVGDGHLVPLDVYCYREMVSVFKEGK